jgi:hypothetical protein
MADVNLRVANSITSSLQRIQKELDRLPDQAFDVFVDNTPVRSGNARRKTQLRGDEIQAKYPYAKRLDEGYSKQSPKGMVEPTERFIQNRLGQIMRKK